MRIKCACAVFGAVLSLMLSPVSGEDLRAVHFKGVIHDYSPSTVSGGPYEMRGEWSLDIQNNGTATFTADLAMETSDYGTSNATKVDPADPATRSPHTHHISMTNASVSYDTSVCPANSPATTGPGRLVVKGAVTTTGNGSPAPFEANGASTMQVCITGGSTVSYSNISLVYTGPATGHFGPQAIHGVVSRVSAQ